MLTGMGLRSRSVPRALLVCGLALACGDSTSPVRAPRTFRMGFSAIPPRPDQAVTLQSLSLWPSGHADAAIMHISVPYVALLSGLTAPQEVRGNELGLANYYRAKGTTSLQSSGSVPQLFVSAQVETAWGRFQGGGYVGIAQDLADFPFIDCLGLSSYPYLGGYADPESVPLDYYARLRAESARPVLVVEGGWTATSIGAIASSPAEQARYLAHQGRLLDSARAVALFHLTFTDLDLSALNVPPGSGLPLFAHLGVVDSALGPKPALAAWDEVLARPFAP